MRTERILGSSAVSGAGSGIAENNLHTKQSLMIGLTTCHPLIIQYSDLTSAKVRFTPPCPVLQCISMMISFVILSRDGMSIGCFSS